MRQTTLAEGSFAKYKKPTRKEKFLIQMDEIIPWKGLSKVIEPHYPRPKAVGVIRLGLNGCCKLP